MNDALATPYIVASDVLIGAKSMPSSKLHLVFEECYPKLALRTVQVFSVLTSWLRLSPSLMIK